MLHVASRIFLLTFSIMISSENFASNINTSIKLETPLWYYVEDDKLSAEEAINLLSRSKFSNHSVNPLPIGYYDKGVWVLLEIENFTQSTNIVSSVFPLFDSFEVFLLEKRGYTLIPTRHSRLASFAMNYQGRHQVLIRMASFSSMGLSLIPLSPAEENSVNC